MKSSRENWGELLKLVTRRNVRISGAAVCGDSNCFCMHRLLVFNLIYIPASDAAQSSSGFLPTPAALWSSQWLGEKKLPPHPSNANRHRPLTGGFVYVWPALYRLVQEFVQYICDWQSPVLTLPPTDRCRSKAASHAGRRRITRTSAAFQIQTLAMTRWDEARHARERCPR